MRCWLAAGFRVGGGGRGRVPDLAPGRLGWPGRAWRAAGPSRPVAAHFPGALVSCQERWERLPCPARFREVSPLAGGAGKGAALDAGARWARTLWAGSRRSRVVWYVARERLCPHAEATAGGAVQRLPGRLDVPKPSTPLFPGELMAFHRKQRGWSQVALAMRLHRSLDWVKSVEQGKRPLDSITTLIEVADVLGVPLSALLGQPLGPPPEGPAMPDPHGVLLELRRVLLHYNGIHGFDRPREIPRPLAELERDLREAERRYDLVPDNISGIIWQLPSLIREARQAVAHAPEGPERRRAWRVLAGLYRLTAWQLVQYGDDELANKAADRAISAAEHAEDPLLIAAGARAMQQVLLVQGDLGSVIELAEAAGRLVNPGQHAQPPQLTVWGSLQLIAAFAAARAQERGEYERLWQVASRAADQLGENRKDYRLDFGPAMAAIQQVGMLVELYEPKQALELAERMPADPLPTVDRRAWHRVHQARANYLRRRDDAAFGLLVEAERVAPEILRYSPRVREMVRAMLRRRRTPVPAEVRALAVRLRVLPA